MSDGTRSFAAAPLLSKPPRVLACVLCQQRKVKCNRKFPCSSCDKSHSQCVPATQATRRRRHKFPEQELLEHVRKYEDLLRQNNIKFEPLPNHPSGEKNLFHREGGHDSDDEHPDAAAADWPSPSTTIKSHTGGESKNILRSLNLRFKDTDTDSNSSHDDVSEVVIMKAWDEVPQNDDHLLFGLRDKSVELSTFHPDPANIFRLWQVYIDNINPLLKVIHTPTLQGRIIDAASNITDVNPNLEALMFSIYCTAILSLDANDIQNWFGVSKDHLLSKCQFGCRQSLLNCGVLRCNDRDCLTALYLYFVSVRTKTVPQSMSSMLGVVIRIAERMGIDSESELAKCTPFEAEMRRRLWWSLVLFDTRMGELADSKSTKLVPTWDCKIPLNVNDSDLRPEMKEPPEVMGKPTEALFAVVRGELGEFARNTMFYLDFTAPALKPVAKDVQDGPVTNGSELITLHKMLEDKYLKSCDPGNSLHFLTVWTARYFLAKYRLMEYYSQHSSPSIPQTEAQRDTAITYALSMIECDTKLTTSLLTKGFVWLVHFYFPFPAYIQTTQNLRRRPFSGQAEHAWTVMNNNYEARFSSLHLDNSPFFKILAKLILQAWEAREVASKQLGGPLTTPGFVTSIRQIIAQTTPNVQGSNAKLPQDIMGWRVDDFLMSMPMDSGNDIYNLQSQVDYAGMVEGPFPHMPGQVSLDADHLDWSAMDWSSMNGPNGPIGEVGPYPQIPANVPFDADGNLNPSSDLGFGEWLG